MTQNKSKQDVLTIATAMLIWATDLIPVKSLFKFKISGTTKVERVQYPRSAYRGKIFDLPKRLIARNSNMTVIAIK